MPVKIIECHAPSLGDPMDKALIGIFSQVLQLLDSCAKSNRRGTDRPVDWPEWRLFYQAAYACGFVCAFPETPADYQSSFMRIVSGEDDITILDLRRIRLAMTFMIRSERSLDSGADTGGGALWTMLQSGKTQELCERLCAIVIESEELFDTGGHA
jgi:hypothetical protein